MVTHLPLPTLVLVVLATSLVRGLDNNVGLTPPMGWSTWNAFGTDINETKIKSIVDSMVSSGMREAGYQYINIDDGWSSGRADDGTLLADPVRFPSGIKDIADYVHSKGLLFGIYTDVGSKTCAGKPGSWGHECQDAATFASWGVDFVKEDHCNPVLTNATSLDTFYIETLTKMRDCLNATGRQVFFNLCVHTCYGANGTSHGKHNPDCWKTWYTNATRLGNSWRSTTDIHHSWASILNNMYRNNEFANKLPLALFSGPGQWNDPDCLLVGAPSITDAEGRKQFTMWSMMASPLLAGNDLRDMSRATIDILTQPDLIAINQDELGIQGTRVAFAGNATTAYDAYGDVLTWYEQEVWCKPLAGGRAALALINHGDRPLNITVDLEKLRDVYPKWFPDYALFSAFEFWSPKQVGLVGGPTGLSSFEFEVSDVAAMLLSPVPKQGQGYHDDFEIRNTSLWYYSNQHAGWMGPTRPWVWMLRNHTELNATLSLGEGRGLKIHCTNMPCTLNPAGCHQSKMASGLLNLLPKNVYGDWSIRYRAPYHVQDPGTTGNSPDMINAYFTAGFIKTKTYWNEINFGFRNYIPGHEGSGPNSQFVSCEVMGDTGPYHIQYVDLGFNFRMGFHNYTISHRPGTIAWIVDGKQVCEKSINVTHPMQGLLSIRTNSGDEMMSITSETAWFKFLPWVGHLN